VPLKLISIDGLLAASLVVNAVLALLHLAAGYVLYTRDVPVAAFGGDSWRPESPKQRVLFGGYLALSFAWLQVSALMLVLLYTGNPIRAWLGVIGLVSFAGQCLVMRRNDPVALSGLLVHLLVLLLWTLVTAARA